MPFKSEKQRRYLWATQPALAKRWAHKYPEFNKGLPMYAKDNNAKDKASPQQGGEKRATVSFFDNLTQIVKNNAVRQIAVFNNSAPGSQKVADSKQERVEIPHSEEPTYAGEERAKGLIGQEFNDHGGNMPSGASGAPAGINALLQKLSVVLSPKVREMLAAQQAAQQGQQPGPVAQNQGIKQYPAAAPIAPPMGMAPGQAPQAQAQPQQAQQGAPATPSMPGVGGGTSPNANPINSYGGLSTSGDINGNAAFGTQNAVGARKFASSQTPCSCGCGDTVATCKCPASCSCRQKGGSCYKAEKQASKPGLWANIHAKRKRGEKPATPGDKDYPDTKSWNKTVKSSGLFDFLNRKPADDWAPPSPPDYAQFDAKGDYGGFDKADTAYLNQMKKYLKSRGYSDIKEQIYEPGGTPWSMRGPDNQYYELQLDADDGPVAKPVPLQKLYGVHKPEEYYRQGPGLAAAPNWEQLNAQSMANSKLRTEADVKKYIQKWVKKHNDPSFIDDSWEALEEDLPLRWGPDAFHPDSFGDELHTDIGNRLRDPKQFDGAMKDLLAKLNLKPTQKAASSPAWQRSAGKNPEGGLNEKGRKSYERETGGNLKAPVTESNPSGERAKRQNSFCSRMCGMKRVNTGASTAKDPDSRINKSLRKWNCKCSSFQGAVEKWAGWGNAFRAGARGARAGREISEHMEQDAFGNDDNNDGVPGGDLSPMNLALATALLSAGAYGVYHKGQELLNPAGVKKKKKRYG